MYPSGTPTYNLAAQIIHLYVRCESTEDKVLNLQQPGALVHALPLALIETERFTLRVPLQSHLRSIGKPGGAVHKPASAVQALLSGDCVVLDGTSLFRQAQFNPHASGAAGGGAARKA